MRITKDPADRKQELLDIALEILLENGYDKTTIKDIVTKAGVAQGLFYYYFPSKEDMTKEIGKQYVEKYLQLLDKIGFNESTDPVQSVKLLLAGTFQFLDTCSKLLYKMHEEGNKTLHDIITLIFIDIIARLVQDIIILGNEQGKFNCTYPNKSANALIFGLFFALHDDEHSNMLSELSNERGFVISYVSRVLNVDEKLLSQIF